MTLPAAVVEEYRRQREALLRDFPELADDPETLADTLEGITSANDVVRSLIRGARVDDANHLALAALIREYAKRGANLDRRAERRRDAAQKIMEAAGIRKVEAPEFTVFMRAVPPRVEVFDEAAVPDDYRTTITVLDKERVREAVKAGQQVDGARLTNGGQTISVRL